MEIQLAILMPSVITLSGNTSILITMHSGINGLGNEEIIISDTTIAASLLNSLDRNTTGNIDASAVITLSGNTSDINTAYASSGINGLGNEETLLAIQQLLHLS